MLPYKKCYLTATLRISSEILKGVIPHFNKLAICSDNKSLIFIYISKLYLHIRNNISFKLVALKTIKLMS